MNKPKREKETKKIISKEFFIGLLAIVLGAYNLLSMFEVIDVDVTIPQLVANILLVLAGLFLWITAYRLSRHKYHSKRLF